MKNGTDTLSVETALLYLRTSPAANAIIQDLEQSPALYIIDASDNVARDEAQPYLRVVYWKPHQALCVKAGTQSPALQLLHELAHLQQAQNHKPFAGDAAENNAVQITNPAARQLGEPTRINYADAHGTPTWPLPIPSR